MLKLVEVEKSNKQIKELMNIHYSHPGGFVGRQIMYGILLNEEFIGAIAGGSATLHLPGRNEFFGDIFDVNKIINNTFFHLLPCDDKNVGTKILKLWRNTIVKDWVERYNEEVIGFETLVELPRSGSLYKADNWQYVGTTKGYTCKRIGGYSNEKWGGIRVWNYENLRPKLVFCKFRQKEFQPKIKEYKRRLF